MIGELGGGEVEAEKECSGETDHGGAAKDGVDADEEADGDAPGEFFGGRTHAEECEDGKGDATVRPVVMDRRGGVSFG